jgi:hypothetical protein
MTVHRLPGDTAVVAAFCAGLPGPTSRSRDRRRHAAVAELGEELGIPVTTVLGPQLARWFLGHLEAIAAD